MHDDAPLTMAPPAGSVYPEIRAGSLPPIPLLKAAQMSERLETLNKARDRMLEDRDAHAKVLAAPFDRDKAERARNKFIEIQILIDALDRAIGGEGAIALNG
jgi:chromosome condensin MukBEF ATPase and DNA-binding subunit MukB